VIVRFVALFILLAFTLWAGLVVVGWVVTQR